MIPSESVCASDNQLLALDLVPQVSAWIPDCLLGLRGSASIRSPNCYPVRAGLLWSPCELPGTECILAKVLSKARITPSLSIVIRNFNFPYAARSGECDALQL